MVLPTWVESTEAFNARVATPLHIFVREQEPLEDVETFRKQLQEAINYAFEQGASK